MRVSTAQVSLSEIAENALTCADVERFSQTLTGAESALTWNLSAYSSINPDSWESLRQLAGRLDRLGVSCTLVISDPAVGVQLDCERLHRRFVIDRRWHQASHSDNPKHFDPCLEEVQDWRGDVEDVVKRLEVEDLSTASHLLRWIVSNEDDLYGKNQVTPYGDLIPKLLVRLTPERLADLLSALKPHVISRILLGDFTRIEDGTLAKIMGAMETKMAAQVAQAMTVGVDRPSRVAPILNALDPTEACSIINAIDSGYLCRMIDAADRKTDAKEMIFRLTPKALTELVLHRLQASDQAAIQAAIGSLQAAELETSNLVTTLLPTETRGVVAGWQGCDPMDPRSLSWLGPDQLSLLSTGTGTRQVWSTEAGRRICIQEEIDSEYGRKSIRIDLLEIDPDGFSISCYMSPQTRPTFKVFDKIFAPYNDGTPPSEEAFRKTGMFLLREAVKNAGAVAGINGNFYFDYGHYIHGQQLGIDFSETPGLAFGDPVGWFVKGGKELNPPIFNRCCLVVTNDGRIDIRRVKMTAIRAGKETLNWDIKNQLCNPGSTGLFTSIWGFRTPQSKHHTDCTVVNGKVIGVHPGGGSTIPFTGFVLSLPNHHPLLSCLHQGQELVVENNFSRDGVREAMAAGPQLVVEGRIEVDFRREDFGRKDSAVMSFFLPRLFESYEAARSFIGKRPDGTMIFGTVSGRACGSGLSGQPAGMTYGELAQLASDLGAIDAMGLDGGGSSSLVARQNGAVQLLNIPTGGSDVPRGAERFISTALLVHKKETS